MTKRVNIIDADTIAFASAVQAQDVSILATHMDNEQMQEWEEYT